MRIRPRVTVIIPTYNRRRSLKRTLRSLANQDYEDSVIEVLVADTGSRDGTGEMINEFRSPLLLRHLPLAKRYALDAPIARNAGAAAAGGEILLFIDSDVVLPQHFVREHVFCHDYIDHAFVGGGVCHVFGMGPEDDYKAFGNPDSYGMLAPYQASMLEFSGNPGSCRFPWSYCYGANYSMTKEDFIAHALYADETFAERGLAASDTELSYRAYLAGLSVVFSRYAVAYHDLGTTPTFNSKERTDRVMKGLDYAVSKHRSAEPREYAAFRAQDNEAFLDELLRGSGLSIFPILKQAEWLSWMEKTLGTAAPPFSILLMTNGDEALVESTLLALDHLGTAPNRFEVLIWDSSAPDRIGVSRHKQTLDLLAQKLKTNFCLRYYPATNNARMEQIAIGLNNCCADLRTLNGSLSRTGWYFSVLNNSSLYGRLRGKRLILLDGNEVPQPHALVHKIDLVEACSASSHERSAASMQDL
jgi:glycosyltransferase involved in cell wall biosynthesis